MKSFTSTTSSVFWREQDKKEFMKVAFATGVGFLVMGFIGFFVKLIHIPVNNIIMGRN